MGHSLIVYRRSQLYSGRTHKHVKMTHVMGSLLHYILTNIEFIDGHFVFDPSPELQKILDEYNINDVIYTYNKLGLNSNLYSDTLVKRAKDYVLRKTVNDYYKYRKFGKNGNNKK